ncbi:MAG: ACP S-malonyltransferase [Flexilinea sp.]
MSKVAFLFAGQGSQYPGMMHDIMEKFPVSREIFKKADRSLEKSISDLCFLGDKNLLDLTENTQPCVFTSDIATFVAVSNYGIKPNAVAGFSLGEYAALTAAGVMEFTDAIQLVQIRAKAMQAAVPVGKGGMVVTGTKSKELLMDIYKQVNSGFLSPANYNCPGQIVFSGESVALEQFVILCLNNKIKAMRLPVSAPFHCELMKSVGKVIEKKLSGLILSDAAVPVYMNVDASKQTEISEISPRLVAQVYSPLLWEQTIGNMINDGFDTFIEVGPGKALSGFVKKIKSDATTFCVNSVETIQELVDKL